jgi:predicted metalloprotease with PDZ domain
MLAVFPSIDFREAPLLRLLSLSVLILAALSGADSAVAQSIAAPADTAYPGNIALNVDLTDLSHRIFRVHEEIPARSGALTLLYPQWLPGNHSPTGPIEQMVGLTITANGQRIEWRRDPIEVFAFHVDVPPGATRLILDFQFVSPLDRDQGRIVVTPEIIGLQWNTVLLYPAGHYSSQITIEPTIKLPSG